MPARGTDLLIVKWARPPPGHAHFRPVLHRASQLWPTSPRTG